MQKIGFIDISGNNCWIVYTMPLGSEQRGEYDLVNAIQQRCIDLNVFGMGWEIDIPGFGNETKMTDENVKAYIDVYKANCGDVSDGAISSYKKIQKGDYVISRNKNGRFYVGRVSSDGAFYLYKKDDEALKYFSWGCKVEKWVEFPTEREVPSEIVGRFSQRFHKTIQRIDGYRQRLLVMAMYDRSLSKEERIGIPKLIVNEMNFISCLNYKELEDLVAIYIADKHRSEGYSLLPSSCKSSQQNIEYYFVSGKRRPITCQVKNRERIDVGRYVHDKAFEKIYIFSGVWDEVTVMNLRKEYGEYPYIHIISPSELYEVLCKEDVFSNPYYDYNGVSPDVKDICVMLDEHGYHSSEDKHLNDPKSYIYDNDFICFLAKDGLFYSKEFGVLVLKYYVLSAEKEKEHIDQIMGILG